MKALVMLLCLIVSLSAQEYVFAGGKDIVGQKISALIIQKAYKRAGINVSVTWDNLQQSLLDSNMGINDGQVGRADGITEKFANLIKVPVPILQVEAVAFSKDDSIEINSWADLKDKDFMVIHGTKFIEYATKDFKRKYANSFDEAMTSLHENKVDIVIAPKIGGLYSIFKNGYKDIQIVSLSLQDKKLYHFVHKKNQHLVPIITPYLEKMKKSSEMRSIRENFLISQLHNKSNK